MTLGERIRLARRNKRPKMTQKQLGKLFGISSQAVAQWENGGSGPERDKMPKLAEILDVRETWLSDEKGPPEREDELSALTERLQEPFRSLAVKFLREMLAAQDRAA